MLNGNALTSRDVDERGAGQGVSKKLAPDITYTEGGGLGSWEKKFSSNKINIVLTAYLAI